MKLALFSDIHSNLEALNACLDHARRQGAGRFAFLGDLVGYGADPASVVDRVREEVERGAIAVRGNHDAAVVGTLSEEMNKAAEAAVAWTRSRLGAAKLDFLAGLPLTAREEDILFVHATANVPEQWIYILNPMQAADSMMAADTAYVFSGHVHDQVLYYMGAARRPMPFRPVSGVPIPVARYRRWLAIVGSVGQPRDGNTAANYALFDMARSTLTFFRIPYDYAAAATKIRAAGLPEALAARLEHGV